MRVVVWTVASFGLLLILTGCGERGQQEPAGAPAVIVPMDEAPLEERAEPDAEPDAQSAMDTPAPPSDRAGDAEAPAAEPMTAQPAPEQAGESQPVVKEALEGSSTRKVLGAVQRALKKAATGGSDQESDPAEAPKFNP